MARKKRDKRESASRHRMHRKEILPVNNLLAMIVVVFILISVLSSYISYTNSKTIVQEMTGELVTEAKAQLCVNKPPSINQSCNTTATIGVGYYCNVNATDPDNDTITFYDNTGLFNIDSNTGEIIFTPAAGDAGVHNIVITASDDQGCSNSNSTEPFTITIPSLPGPPTPPGGGGGGGVTVKCIPQWECTPWSSCRPDMTRTRTCYSLNGCLEDKPDEISDCIYVRPPVPRAPRYRQFEFCNFDEEDSCLRNVGLMEDWLMTYKGKVGVLNFLHIDDSGIDVSIDDETFFFVGMKRIRPRDLDGDGVEDVEFIYHSTTEGRGDVTGKRIRQLEVVLERPVYIERLPWWLTALLIFVYDNACLILLIVLILAAILIYAELMKKFEEHEEEKEKEKSKAKRKRALARQ
jgi:uncharacterized protein YpmB